MSEIKQALDKVFADINKKIEYTCDDAGIRENVIIPYKDYKRLLKVIEDLEDVIAYDEAINDDEYEVIPFPKADE